MTSFAVNKTRTWKGRHLTYRIPSLMKALDSLRISKPSVVQIGPGGISENWAHLFPEGDELDRTFVGRKLHQIVAAPETYDRDNPKTRLVTHETREIYEMLEERGGFSRFVVVEINPRVCEAVSRLNLPGVEIKQWDIQKGLIPDNGTYLKGNLVVAYKVLEHCQDRSKALASIIRTTEEKGVLGLTIPEGESTEFSGFQHMVHGTYIKRSNFFKPRPLDYSQIEKSLL